jgi:hypothetical protein
MFLHRVELSKMVTTTLCAAGSFSSYEERATGRDGCRGLTDEVQFYIACKLYGTYLPSDCSFNYLHLKLKL